VPEKARVLDATQGHSAPTAPSGAEPEDDRLPERMGRYEVLQELGRGAMGIVYKAWDPSLGRLVAIKRMHSPAQLLGPAVSETVIKTFLERFRREAQSAALLAHVGIVAVHDFVQDDPKHLALVMEFVDGKTLDSYATTRLPVDQSLDLVIQVAEALDFAHARGIVHRDIKPANVLVTTDRKAKVSDFGLAKLDGSSLTRTGEILGTPAFMSPEQFLGEEVDARSDLFSLGCVLYWLCTGEKPFNAPSLSAIALKVVKEPFKPMRELNPDLPPELDPLLERVLAKAPAERYQGAADLAADLKSVRSRCV
jgi:serine/threonine-protein kinase